MIWFPHHHDIETTYQGRRLKIGFRLKAHHNKLHNNNIILLETADRSELI